MSPFKIWSINAPACKTALLPEISRKRTGKLVPRLQRHQRHWRLWVHPWMGGSQEWESDWTLSRVCTLAWEDWQSIQKWDHCMRTFVRMWQWNCHQQHKHLNHQNAVELSLINPRGKIFNIGHQKCAPKEPPLGLTMHKVQPQPDTKGFPITTQSPRTSGQPRVCLCPNQLKPPQTWGKWFHCKWRHCRGSLTAIWTSWNQTHCRIVHSCNKTNPIQFGCRWLWGQMGQSCWPEPPLGVSKNQTHHDLWLRMKAICRNASSMELWHW